MALWTVALDSEGQRINIEHAHRHVKYTCVNCGEAMMAKKGQNNEHHFSHYSVTQQCDHDRWLHKEILRVMMERLEHGEPVIINTPDGKLDISDHLSYSKEKKYEDWVPDILIEKTDDVIFVEVCVTSPCSEDKISSGHKIIEIITSDARAVEELQTEQIHSDAQFYKLEFYNFENQKKDALSKVAQTDIPDIISGEEDRQIGSGKNTSKDKQNPIDVNVPYCPHVSAFDGKHASYFILHSNGLYEVKQRAEYCATDILVLGIHTVPDFALNIGKAYAWRKGLLSVEALTKYEQRIDIPAVVTSFKIVELNRPAGGEELK